MNRVIDRPVLDDEDIALFDSRGWHRWRDGYYRTRIDGKQKLLHRLIMSACAGDIVDHINGDRNDNRRSNLRLVNKTASNQNRSRRSDSTAPYKGITKPKNGRWVAQIQVDKKYIRIGAFDTAEDAARAYDAAAIKHHGEFARINGI